MTAHYNLGQIVRTYPINGMFATFEIEGFKGEDLVVRNTAEIMETETWSRDQVELYCFVGKYGAYTIEDEVVAPGFEGTWKIRHFTQSPRNLEQEWGACLVNVQTGKLLFWPAHLIKKA